MFGKYKKKAIVVIGRRIHFGPNVHMDLTGWKIDFIYNPAGTELSKHRYNVGGNYTPSG
jgi:hypothetical protein